MATLKSVVTSSRVRFNPPTGTREHFIGLGAHPSRNLSPGLFICSAGTGLQTIRNILSRETLGKLFYSFLNIGEKALWNDSSCSINQ